MSVGLALLATMPPAHAAQDEARSLNELRHTVVNLLQGLVDKGVLTREQAEKMVTDAQNKAQSDVAAQVAQEKAEEGAVRVPYVPQIIKDEIRRQVTSDLSEQVTRNVVEAAEQEGWGVPAALPDWARRMRWYGDIRVRGQSDNFASDNIGNTYLDFQRVNDAGGIGKAGLAAFINTSEDRERLRGRLRFGFETALGHGWTMGARLATGSLRDPISTNQTLGNYGFRNQIAVDLAYIDWAGTTSTGRHNFGISAGRIKNPFFTATELVYDPDLTFEGVAGHLEFGLDRRDSSGRYAFLVAGAFPLQEVELSSQDKWLLGGQLGLNWKYSGGSRTRLGAGVYHFRDIAGRRNGFESNLLDFTAPPFLSRGNTLFDIRNDSDNTTNLYALAADYTLANVSLAHEWRLGPEYRITLAADGVRNIGYDTAKIVARTGFSVPRRNKGYQAEIGFGSIAMNQTHAWRATVGYRYVERDAVLDAFTDSDFHLGGTDAKGFMVGVDYAMSPMVTARLKYLSANEIDGPPLGIDLLQIDLTASF